MRKQYIVKLMTICGLLAGIAMPGAVSVYASSVDDNSVYADGAERMAAEATSAWLKDYRYEIRDNRIILNSFIVKKYTMRDMTELYIPGSAVVDGVEYDSVELSNGIWNEMKRALTLEDTISGKPEKLSFGEGVLFPADCSHMFEGLDMGSFDGRNADTSHVTDMSYMFNDCTMQGMDVSTWDTSHVTDMSYMFAESSFKDTDISEWDTSHVTDMSYMFAESSFKDADISAWDTSNVTDMQYMFSGCFRMETIDLSSWNVSHVTNMSHMFYMSPRGIGSSPDTEVRAFPWLGSVAMNGLDLSNVEDMSGMFKGCLGLETVDFGGCDLSSLGESEEMFYETNLVSIQTPLHVKSAISLQDPMYDKNWILYSTLPVNSSVSFELRNHWLDENLLQKYTTDTEKAAAAAERQDEQNEFIPGQIYIRFRPGVGWNTSSDIRQLTEAYRKEDIGEEEYWSSEQIITEVWTISDQLTVQTAIRMYESIPCVLDAWPCGPVRSDLPFTDVKAGAFYEEPVLWAVHAGITSGVTASRFNPKADCSRAQVVTFLWRAEGSPEPELEDSPFTDVHADSYYYKAVLWAVENGITQGLTAHTFGPNESCTRAQVVTFLWRTAGRPDDYGDAGAFEDIQEERYYYDPVRWAVGAEVTSGTSDRTFSPDAVCERGQVVTFLYRALNE